jgi:hypothetical protein
LARNYEVNFTYFPNRRSKKRWTKISIIMQLCEEVSEYELIVDSAEQAIERPGDYQEY